MIICDLLPIIRGLNFCCGCFGNPCVAHLSSVGPPQGVLQYVSNGFNMFQPWKTLSAVRHLALRYNLSHLSKSHQYGASPISSFSCDCGLLRTMKCIKTQHPGDVQMHDLHEKVRSSCMIGRDRTRSEQGATRFSAVRDKVATLQPFAQPFVTHLPCSYVVTLNMSGPCVQ